MDKFTPGPWVQCGGLKHNIGNTFGAKKEKGTWIVMCHPLNGTEEDAVEVQANSYLIAAAPEMLEALRLAKVGLEYRSVENHFSLEAVNAAIKKAEGER